MATGPPDPTDTDLEGPLRAGAAELWDELWAAADSMTTADTSAVWSGEGWATYSDTVGRILGLWSALRIVQPLDWVGWGGLARYRGGEGLQDAPVAEAVRLATAIVRADRFNEGEIETALRDGTFQAVLQRLRRWHDETW